jgi:hypothetical protein
MERVVYFQQQTVVAIFFVQYRRLSAWSETAARCLASAADVRY